MRKEIKLLSFLLIILLLFSLIPIRIYAARSSTGGSSSSNTQNQQQASVNCEDRTLRADRIRCRLENKDRLADSEQARIPESCRKIALTATSETSISRDECIGLYRRVLEERKCYERSLSHRQKVICFREVAGLTIASLSGQSERKKEIRSYVVFLLYELQERIENAVGEGKLNETEAAQAIEIIVQIKEKIMNGGAREEVIPLLQDLRVIINGFKNKGAIE